MSNTPVVKIVSDEEDKAIQELVDKKVAEKLALLEGKVPGVVDPRNTPNFKNWQGGLTKSPFGDTNGAPAQPEGGSDFRGVIKEFLDSGEFKEFQSRGMKVSRDFTPTLKSVWGDRRTKAGVYLPDGYVTADIVSRAAQMTGVSDGRTVLGTGYDQMIHLKPNRVLHIRDLLNVIPVNTGDEKFLQEAGFTNNGTMMPENTDPGSTTSMTASVMGVTLVTVNIKNIATKITLPTQYLDDVEKIQAFLEMRLEEMGFDTEDAQLCSGDGTGNNMKGFFTDSGIQLLNWSDGDLDDTEIDAVLNGMVLAWVVNHEPDGHVAHTTEWAKMAKKKDSQKRYLIDGVHQTNANKMLWGKPVAVSNAAPTGKWLTGSFAASAALYDRQQPTIWMSREHSDNADKNLVTFFLNMRSALAKFRPEGFVKITFDAAPE